MKDIILMLLGLATIYVIAIGGAVVLLDTGWLDGLRFYEWCLFWALVVTILAFWRRGKEP